MKLVYVEWLDAHYTEGPVEDRGLFLRPLEMKSAGLLVDESEAGLTFCGDACVEPGHSYKRHVSFVPWEMIRVYYVIDELEISYSPATTTAKVRYKPPARDRDDADERPAADDPDHGGDV